MPPVSGGIEGEFKGRVYPVVIGLKAGPSPMHYCGEGTTWEANAEWVIVTEPSGGPVPNTIHIPRDNVAFIAAPMFVIEKPEK
jgi:hypothetical protein